MLARWCSFLPPFDCVLSSQKPLLESFFTFSNVQSALSLKLENGLFVTDFAEKAHIFNDHFVHQCTTIDTGSELPQNFVVTTTSIPDFAISEEKILNIIRS